LFEYVSDSAGERLDGIDSEGAAQRLRGNAGTTVTVKVHCEMIILPFFELLILLDHHL
jgi:hypothetical protein